MNKYIKLLVFYVPKSHTSCRLLYIYIIYIYTNISLSLSLFSFNSFFHRHMKYIHRIYIYIYNLITLMLLLYLGICVCGYHIFGFNPLAHQFLMDLQYISHIFFVDLLHPLVSLPFVLFPILLLLR